MEDEPDREAELDQQWNALLKNESLVRKLCDEAGKLFSLPEQRLRYVVLKLREHLPLDD